MDAIVRIAPPPMNQFRWGASTVRTQATCSPAPNGSRSASAGMGAVVGW